jgi:hypothetical protein
MNYPLLVFIQQQNPLGSVKAKSPARRLLQAKVGWRGFYDVYYVARLRRIYRCIDRITTLF